MSLTLLRDLHQAAATLEAVVVTQHVWGVRPGHRDELILRGRATGAGTSSSSAEPLDERLWCLMDYYDPTAIVDTEGAVVERYRFSAFGLRAILDPDFEPRAESDYAWDLAFKGQFLDLESGYYNYGYRYYSPELGRWLSRDPIGEGGGVNLYAMAGNDPGNIVDFLGLACLIKLSCRLRHFVPKEGPRGCPICYYICTSVDFRSDCNQELVDYFSNDRPRARYDTPCVASFEQWEQYEDSDLKNWLEGGLPPDSARIPKLY